jgi:hypothetical protein
VPRLDMNNPRYIENIYPTYRGIIKDGKVVLLVTYTVESVLKNAEEFYGKPVLPR